MRKVVVEQRVSLKEEAVPKKILQNIVGDSERKHNLSKVFGQVRIIKRGKKKI